MTLAAKLVVSTGEDEITSLDLVQDASATVLIDPEGSEILAVNAAGGATLGLFPYVSFPVALDPAMPAIARLRQIASAGYAGKDDLETLLFWSSGRLKRVKGKVIKRGGKDSKVLLLHIEKVESPDDDPPPQPQCGTPAASFGVEAGVPASTPKPLTGLDADTLANIAHELMTPLTAIAVAAEIMRDERLGEMKNARYLSYAADIHESVTHALNVITSLLGDRMKPAAPVSRLITLDLNAIVECTASSVKALAESCGLTLSFNTDGSKPHVVVNPTALRQILFNLLANAIKFTSRGGDIRVATGQMDDGRVFLTVCNTDCSMAGSHAELAGPLAASDLQPAWARSYGIGLPLVGTLVRNMGAEIKIDSVPQKGTTATIFI